MELEAEVLERARGYQELSQWERSELGRELRGQGLSYGEIMEVIPVRKSTLATWCRDVELSSDQIAAIKKRRAPQPGIPRDTQRKRRKEVRLIKTQALLEAEVLVDDPFWVAGVVMYWGEGFKTQNQLSMANADPHALRLFMRWADNYLKPTTGWRARINLHADNDPVAAHEWWAKELSLKASEFTKAFIKPDGTGHRKNHLAAGVCTVTKRRCADSFYTTTAWIGFLQKTMGH